MSSWQQISKPPVRCKPSIKTLNVPEGKTKFFVAGLMASSEFQKCQFLVKRLSTNYPDKYEEPELRPMMNVEWNTFLLKMRRRHGGALWKTSSPVVVFMNGKYFGDEAVLVDFVSQTYLISLDQNFEQMGEVQLSNHLKHMSQFGTRFVTLILSSRDKFIGSLLIMLYADLVPKTCRFFMNRCQSRDGSWDQATVVRVVPDSWIQFKGINVPPYTLPCENYTIPHDRRGVVSMCNYKKHYHNTQQFNITLNATPWMDHKYVAFGLVVQGDETLIELEKLEVASDYSPTTKVYIDGASEFAMKKMELDNSYLLKKTSEHTGLTIDKVESEILEKRYRQGKYCMKTDLESHLPFLHLPDYMLAYLKKQEVEVEVEEQAEEVLPQSESTLSTISEFELHVARSKAFRVHSVLSLENITETSNN